MAEQPQQAPGADFSQPLAVPQPAPVELAPQTYMQPPPAPPSYYSSSPALQQFANYQPAEDEYDEEGGDDYDDDDDYGSAKKKKTAKRSSAKRAGGRPKKAASVGSMRQAHIDPTTLVPPPIVTQLQYQHYTPQGFVVPMAPGMDMATADAIAAAQADGIRRSGRARAPTSRRVDEFDDEDDEPRKRTPNRRGSGKRAATPKRANSRTSTPRRDMDDEDEEGEEDFDALDDYEDGSRRPRGRGRGGRRKSSEDLSDFAREAFASGRRSGLREKRSSVNYAEMDREEDWESDEVAEWSGDEIVGANGEVRVIGSGVVGALAEGDEELQPSEKAFERIIAYREEKHIDPGQKHETLHADSGAPKAYEYLIKYKGLSFLHAEWVKPAVIEAAHMGKMRIQRFLATNPELDPDLPFDPDWVEIDRIIAKRVRNGEVYYLIKWCALPYSESTWEKASQVNNDEKIADYEFFNTLPPKSDWKPPATRPPANKFQEYPNFDFKSGNQLRAYQLEGVNWLRFCWYNKRNSILADEMGLGKTVQAVSSIFCLKRYEGIRGPFLVIAPLSTIPHWKREFEGWTDMNPIVYHGNMLAREIIRRHEFRYDDPESQAADVYKFNVIITTYEMVLQDAHIFRPVVWKYVAIDEAHRLKNKSSRLLQEFRTFRYNHLLLLTGTPIQNNTEELWTLLNLLDGDIFPSLNDFSREFGDLQNQDQVRKLQGLLKPFLLRRLKEDVEKSIAPKEETIIEVELTTIQKKYYRAVLERNFEHLVQKSKSSLPSLINIMMQLRKCCNHPFLLKGVEEVENAGKTPDEAHKTLIEASGKLVLIDKLLPRLRAEGHKVLVFSQMVKVLDLLEDYLNFRGYKHERIDGAVRGNDRQAAIDRFSKPDSDTFIFLLCTRAGGVGINLTAADTVIIYDSDWNPQNDLQAQARCHRIGQEKMVKVYRLLTRKTYEREMFERASLKLGLDQAVLNNVGDSENKPKLSQREVDSLLKYGAYDMFRDGDDIDSEKFHEENIDTILQGRTKTIVHEVSNTSSNFSKASFSSETANPELDVNDPDFWKKLMPDQAAKPDPNIIEAPRQRKQVQRPAIPVEETSDMDDSELEESDEENGGPDSEDEAYEQVDEPRRGPGRPPGPSIKRPKHWNISQRNRFTKALIVYGFGRWRDVRKHARLHRPLRELACYARAYLHKLLDFVKLDEGETKEMVTMRVLNCDTEELEDDPSERDKKMQIDILDWGEDEEHDDDAMDVDRPGATTIPVDVSASPAAAARKEKSPDQIEVQLRPFVDHYKADPTLTEAKFVEALQKSANVTIKRFELLAEVGRLVRSDYGEFENFPKLEMAGGDMYSWWGVEEDKALLRGTHKYGFGRYNLTKRDPEFCFVGRVKLGKDEEEEDEDIKEEETGKKKRGPKSKKKPEPEKPAVVKNEEPVDDSNLFEMPTSKLLTHRVKHLLKAFSSMRRVSNSSTYRPEKYMEKKGGRYSKPDNEWSKRERQDFYRAVTTFGIHVNEKGEDDFAQLHKAAGFKFKSVENVIKYYEEFYAICDYIRKHRMQKKQKTKQEREAEAAGQKSTDEKDEGPAPGEEEIHKKAQTSELTFTQGKRVCDRLNFFSALRRKVLKMTDEELVEKLTGFGRSGMPEWWIPVTHDIPLLKAVEKHGFGKWEDVCSDKNFPFYELAIARMKEKGIPIPDPNAKPIIPSTPEKSAGKKSATPGKPGKKAAAAKKAEDDDDDDEEEDNPGKTPFASAIEFPKDKVTWKRLTSLVKQITEVNTPRLTFASGVPKVGPVRQTQLSFTPGSILLNPQTSEDEWNTTMKRRKRGQLTGDDELMELGPDGTPSKRSAPAVSRRAMAFDRDEVGNVKFPIKMGVLTIEALGQIDSRPAFHSEKYIWPVGFRSTREYMSTVEKDKRCNYLSVIKDDGGKPLFEVIPEDDPDNPASSNSASNAWKQILERVNKIRNEPNKRTSVSGPEYFGFGVREVMNMITCLPGAENCVAYVGVDAKPRKKRKTKAEKEAEEAEEVQRGGDDDDYESIVEQRFGKGKRSDEESGEESSTAGFNPAAEAQ